MWNQWSQYAGAPPLPTTAPPPPPQEPVAVPTPAAPPIIGPMLPSAAAAPMPTVPLASAAAPTGTGVNPYSQYTSAQYAAMTPEQQYALQQHWMQWQKYQEEYARWHAQYGEQYKREMEMAQKTAGAVPSVSSASGSSVFASPFYQQPPPSAPSSKITGQPQFYAQPPPPQATSANMSSASNHLSGEPMPWQPPQQPSQQPPSFNQPPPNLNQQNFNSNNSHVGAQQFQQAPWGVEAPRGVAPPSSRQTNCENSQYNRNDSVTHGRNTDEGPNNRPEQSNERGADNFNQNKFGNSANNRNNRNNWGNNQNSGDDRAQSDNWDNSDGSANRNFGSNNRIGCDPSTSFNAVNESRSDKNAPIEKEDMNEDSKDNVSDRNTDEPNNWIGRGNNYQMGPDVNDRNRGQNNWNDNSNERNFRQNSEGSNNARGPNNWNDGFNNRGNEWKDNLGPNNRNNRGSNNWNQGPNDRGPDNWNEGPNNRGQNNWNDRSNNRGTNNWNEDSINRGKNNWNQGSNNRGQNCWNDGPNTRGNNGPDDWNDNRRANDRNFGLNNRGSNNDSYISRNRGMNDRNFGQTNRGNNRGPDNWENNSSNNSGPNVGQNQRNQSPSIASGSGNRKHISDLDEEMFDRQFRQWEQQFEDWKKANANHPDKEMYKQYEQEFEKQRKRISERREQMRRRKLEQMGLNPNQPPPQLSSDPPQSSSDTPQLSSDTLHPPSDTLHPTSDTLHPPSDTLHPTSDTLHPPSDTSHSLTAPLHPSPDPSRTDSAGNERSGNPQLMSRKRNDSIGSQQSSSSKQNQECSQEMNSTNENAQETRSETPEDNEKTYEPIKDNENSDGKDLTDEGNKADTFKENSQQKKNTFTPLGKRKSRFDTATPIIKIKPIINTEIINLDDDDTDREKIEDNQGKMSEIFKKVDGIPGLDLNDDTSSGPTATATATASKNLLKTETKPDQNKTYKNLVKPTGDTKKIPSLFDIKVDKPDMTDINNEKEQSPAPASSTALPDLAKTLNDPDFLKRISEAVAHAKGGDISKVQEVENRQLSFSEWQQHKQGDAAENKPADGNADFHNTNSGDFRDKNSNCSATGEDFNPNSKSNSRGDLPSNNGNNFGPNNDFGPNGPPNWGASGNNNWGSNAPNNWGPNGPNNWRSNGPNNWGYNGPNNSGPNIWASNNSGPNGPNNWGPNGPNNFGSNTPSNWGPNGSNNMGSNAFNNWGSNDNNFRSGNGFGRNFGGNGGANFGPNDGPRRNFGQDIGSGRNFDRNGSNFGRNDGPNDGPGRNFGGNGGNYGSNDGTGRNYNRDTSNFGYNDGPGGNFARDASGKNNRNRGRSGSSGRRDETNNRSENSNNRRDFSNNRNNRSNDGNNSDDTGTNNRNINNPFRRNDAPKDANLETDNAVKSDHSDSWTKGPDARDNLSYDDYYRPVQVIDYSNSNAAPTTTITPRVIDYGHKPVVNDESKTFKPLKIINYDHASKAKKPQQQTHVNPSQKRRKRKNKNNLQQQNQNQKQKQKQKQNKQQQQQQQTTRTQPQQNLTTVSNKEKDVQKQNNIADADKEHEELEEISDVEDIPEEPKSPPPPPPPMFNTSGTFTPFTSQLTPSSIFPSTSDANENLPKMSSIHLQMSIPTEENNNTISIDEILMKPGRQTRPKRICIILRGPPGSGKSHVAKLIKEKEKEMSGSNPRILSIDDYFIIENDYEEKCPKTGKKIPKKELLYEYDKDMEEKYLEYLIKAFKKSVADNFYDFIVIDCNNNSLRSLNEFYCHSKDSGFVPYIIDLFCDLETCLERNIHQRSERDIKNIINTWKPTPGHYIKLDISSLLQNVVEMEDAEDMAVDENAVSENADSYMTTGNDQHEADDANEGDNDIVHVVDDNEEENSNDSMSNQCGFLKSKWETDTTIENLARLDGTSKLATKRKPTMEEYLQMDEWEPSTNTKGKKRVRWADIEEKREQEKMRAVGFVVGQTDWKRMMDPYAARRALNQTKYIERLMKRVKK